MNKFKVGDKIRFIGNKESLTDYAVPDELHDALLKPGSFFIVLEYSPRDGVRLEGFGEWWVQNEAVELVPPTLQFKVDDVIRVTWPSHRHYRCTGEVTHIYNDGNMIVRIYGFGLHRFTAAQVEIDTARENHPRKLVEHIVATERMVHAQELYHQCLSLRDQCFNLGMGGLATSRLAETATALQAVMGEEITKQKQ